MAGDRLDLGIAQTQRLLDQQLASIDSIQAKIGVLLGFSSASLALIFSFGSAWVTVHTPIAALSAVLLLASVTTFGGSLMLADYDTAPDPTWLVDLLNNKSKQTDAIKEDIIGSLWKAFDKNKQQIEDRLSMVNLAIGLLIAGLLVFVVGVFVT